MFIAPATDRRIGVTRKCLKDSGLLDVAALPVEARASTLTSALRGASLLSLAAAFLQSH